MPMSLPLGASGDMQLGSPSALIISCKLHPPWLFPLHGKKLTNFAHLKQSKPSYQWKTGLKTTHGSFFVEAVATVFPSEKTLQPLKQEAAAEAAAAEEGQIIASDVQSKSDLLSIEDGEEIDDKERKRRRRISKANKGKVPWNKGRKHSPETLARIKERTKLAMQNPKIRKKLSILHVSRPQSEDTKERIRAALKRGWERRRKKSLLQETCTREWKESIAEAARRGGDGKDELFWDSYKILKGKLRQEWLEALKAIAKDQHGVKRAHKSAEQRQKIAEAIRAKWVDPDYRQNVQIGKQKVSERKRLMAPIKVEKKQAVIVSKVTMKERLPERRKQVLGKTPFAGKCKHVKVPSSVKKKSPPSYSDPLAGEKLQMIKQLRANRAAMELKKRRATERARLLIGEAEKAAKALEAAVAKDASAQAFLSETRRLLDEAIHSMQSAEFGKSEDAPMLQKDSERPTYEETFDSDHFMGSYDITAPVMLGPRHTNSMPHSSLSKSRKSYENNPLASMGKVSFNGKAARRPYESAHEPSCPVSTPKISSFEPDESINEDTGLEQMPPESCRENAMLSAEVNSVGSDSSCRADEPLIGNTAWKVEARPLENHREDISTSVEVYFSGTSLANFDNSIQNLVEKFEASSFQIGKDDGLTTEKKTKKKWVRGRLVELKDT